MKPSKPNAVIPKFRVSFSLEQLKTIHASLAVNSSKILENAELIAWIGKNIRKAEFGVLEASHTAKESSSSLVSAKVQAIFEEVKEDTKKNLFELYQNKDMEVLMQDEEVIQALQYKMENPTECGTLTEEEKEVLNEAMTKKLMAGL